MAKRQNNYPVGLDWKLRNIDWLAREAERERERRRRQIENELLDAGIEPDEYDL